MTTVRSQTRDQTPRVTVIGMGTMGAAVAHRLLDSGLDVSVWSRHPTSALPLVEHGAKAYDEATYAVQQAEVVITLLPTAEATVDVMLGGQVLGAMPLNSIWAQMATIGVDATEKLAVEAEAVAPGVSFVDAPVSGSRSPAENGQLLILASGPHGAERALEPVFGALGRATLWLGSAGGGSRMKLVLNTWLAFQTEGAAEAAALAERLGLTPSALFAALDQNPLVSPYSLSKLTKMVDEDYRSDFSLDWALKDLDLVASDAGAGVAPIAGAIAERWRGLVHDGASGLDVSAARLGLGTPAPHGAAPQRISADLSSAGRQPVQRA